MGAPTLRKFERLIQLGDTGESSYNYNGDPNGPMSDLFNTAAARSNWIASVTTIAGVHDGSTLAPKLDAEGVPLTTYLKQILLTIGEFQTAATWFTGSGAYTYIYNFGFYQFTDMELPASVTTMAQLSSWADGIFSNTKFSSGYQDLADYDLTPHAMKIFNAAGPRVYSDTRYFAMNTWATTICALAWDNQCADLTINPIMAPTADIMGTLTDYWGNNPTCDQWGDCYGDPWECNDGLVSKSASTGPTWGVPTSGPFSSGAPVNHPTDIFGNYLYSKSALSKGQWYIYPVNRDHVQSIGLSILWTPMYMYTHIANCINAIKYDN